MSTFTFDPIDLDLSRAFIESFWEEDTLNSSAISSTAFSPTSTYAELYAPMMEYKPDEMMEGGFIVWDDMDVEMGEGEIHSETPRMVSSYSKKEEMEVEENERGVGSDGEDEGMGQDEVERGFGSDSKDGGMERDEVERGFKSDEKDEGMEQDEIERGFKSDEKDEGMEQDEIERGFGGHEDNDGMDWERDFAEKTDVVHVKRNEIWSPRRGGHIVKDGLSTFHSTTKPCLTLIIHLFQHLHPMLGQ